MKHPRDSVLTGFARHDHQQCVSAALTEAENYCRHNKLRFTRVRKRSLGILLENHCAMGAYDLLHRLEQEGLGSKPPVAYRALGFLLDHGFVHRIEKLNAFVACAYPGASHQPAFLICSDCGAVAEANIGETNSWLTLAARQNGFQITHCILEADGQCQKCQQA
ncbi:MAG: Fur family transcriptional regulator [Granulosicoccus sp.]